MDPRKLLEALGNDDQTVTDIRRVLRAIMKRLGGPEGFAELICQDYTLLEAGNPGRIKIGSDILRTMASFGEQDDATNNADLSTLEARARELLGPGDDSGIPEHPSAEAAEG